MKRSAANGRSSLFNSIWIACLLGVGGCQPGIEPPSSTQVSDSGTDDTDNRSDDTNLNDNGPDTDGDGIGDYVDNCSRVDNPEQADVDADGAGDECDNCPDIANSDQDESVCDSSDSDQIPDAYDNCPEIGNADQDDEDRDGVGDVCDNCPSIANYTQSFSACTSNDGDSIADAIDNCPEDNNPSQTDGDHDGVGDVCDNCADVANSDQDGPDGSDTGDACQNLYTEVIDSDGDGDDNQDDNCPSVSNANQANSDDDSLGDACDNCDNDDNFGQEDADSNGVGDACDTDITNEPICATGSTDASAIAPNLYFIVDRSGSMANTDGTGVTRWVRVTNALDNMASQLVSNFNVGFGHYPGSGDCGPPASSLVMGTHSASTFQSANNVTPPTAGVQCTPTAYALRRIRVEQRYNLSGDSETGRPKAVVLMTDGWPNSALGPSGVPTACNNTNDAEGALAEATELANLGIRVYMIGLNGVNEGHMQDMANAGNPAYDGLNDTPWYAASSEDEIIEALEQIEAVATSCSFSIEESGEPNYDRVRAVFDRNGSAAGEESVLNATQYTINGGTLSLGPSACADLQSAVEANSNAEVRLQVACTGEPMCEADGPEICDYIDNDCDGQVDEGCVGDVPEVCDGEDNDDDGTVDEGCACMPEAEICDDLDNDCDGDVDEGCRACRPVGEICGDGVDNDCDGQVDENCSISVI